MIISYREGCSGGWLAQLLICDRPMHARFQQDLDAFYLDNIYDVNDWNVNVKRKYYKGQKVLVGHLTNYKLVKELWPEETIYRIKPVTKVFKAISLMFHKKYKVNNIDYIVKCISEYYQLYESDQEPDYVRVLDFGQLDRCQYLQDMFNITLNSYQKDLLKDYWDLQQPFDPLDESLLKEHITKEELKDIFFNNTAFNLAAYIFIYEKLNNLQESQRLWTIDAVDTSWSWDRLLDTMEYQ